MILLLWYVLWWEKGECRRRLQGDQRALLIDELSNYVNVETAEMEVFNYSDPDNPTGAKRFIVNISNGCTTWLLAYLLMRQTPLPVGLS